MGFYYKSAIAARQGISHKKTNTPCQDSVIEYRCDGYYFLGLSDGAGSAKYSNIGSEQILFFLTLHLRIYFEDYQNDIIDANKNLLSIIHIALKIIAKKNKVNVDELSSTLLLFVIKGNKYMIIHLGDGVVGKLDKNNNLSVLSEPENGEFYNITFFSTTTDSNRVRFYYGDISDISGIVLMSDGVEESLYDYKTRKLVPATKKIIKWLDNGSEEEITSVLSNNLKNVFAKKSDDDLSIAIWRKYSKENKNESI
jgi:serine/threonine protein phosphatase PrpC